MKMVQKMCIGVFAAGLGGNIAVLGMDVYYDGLMS